MSKAESYRSEGVDLSCYSRTANQDEMAQKFAELVDYQQKFNVFDNFKGYRAPVSEKSVSENSK